MPTLVLKVAKGATFFHAPMSESIFTLKIGPISKWAHNAYDAQVLVCLDLPTRHVLLLAPPLGPIFKRFLIFIIGENKE
jgi:hypothetical protein